MKVLSEHDGDVFAPVTITREQMVMFDPSRLERIERYLNGIRSMLTHVGEGQMTEAQAELVNWSLMAHRVDVAASLVRDLSGTIARTQKESN